MGIYSHGAMSHMGLPHTVGDPYYGVGSVYANLQTSDFEKCPWSTAGYLFLSTDSIPITHYIIISKTDCQLSWITPSFADPNRIDSRAPPSVY